MSEHTGCPIIKKNGYGSVKTGLHYDVDKDIIEITDKDIIELCLNCNIESCYYVMSKKSKGKLTREILV